MDQYTYRQLLAERLMQDNAFAPPQQPIEMADSGVPPMLARPEDGGAGVPPMLARPPEPPLLDGGMSRMSTPAANMSVAPPPRQPLDFERGDPAAEAAAMQSQPPSAPVGSSMQQSDTSVNVSVPVEPSVRIPGSSGKLVERRTVGDGSDGAMNKSFDDKAQGAKEAGDIRISVGEALQQDIELQKSQILEQQIASAKMHEAREVEKLKRQQEIDQDAKEIASQKIDPDQIFSGPGGEFRKVASIISMALGGFLQGMRGGENPALTIMNQQIDRSIAAQKFAHDAKLKSAEGKKSAFNIAMQRYGDADAAEGAARVYMLDRFKSDAEGRMLKAKTEEERAQLADYLKGIDAQRQQYIANTTKQVMAGGATAMRYLPKLGIMVTEKQYADHVLKNADKATDSGLRIGEKQAEDKAKGGKGMDDRWVDTGGGKGYYARSIAEAESLNKEYRDIQTGMDAAERMKDLVLGPKKVDKDGNPTGERDGSKGLSTFDKVIAPVYETEAAGRVRTAQGGIVTANAKANGSGSNITEGEVSRSQGQVGDQLKVFNSDTQLKKLEEVQANLDRRRKVLDAGRNPTARPPDSFRRSE